MDKDQRKSRIPFLIGLVSAPSVCATLCTPAFPAMDAHFGGGIAMGNISLVIYLLGGTLGQLIYGPLSNNYGRQGALLFGLCLAVAGAVASFLLGLWDAAIWFLFSRFITGIGIAVCFVLTFAMISDTFTVEEARKVVPIVSGAFAVIPYAAVMLGGIFVEKFGWRSCFFLLAMHYTLLLVWALAYSGISSGANRIYSSYRQILSGYFDAFADVKFLLYCSLLASTTFVIYAYIASAPEIMIVTFDLAPQSYGYVALGISFSHLLGTIFARGLAFRINATKVILLGGAILLIVASVLRWHVANAPLDFVLFTLLFISAFFAFPLIYSNAIALAGEAHHDTAIGSAVMNFLNMVSATLSTVIVLASSGGLAALVDSITLASIWCLVAVCILGRAMLASNA